MQRRLITHFEENEMSKKLYLLLVLLLAMTMMLVACGGSDTEEPAGGDSAETETQTETEPEPEPTEEPEMEEPEPTEAAMEEEEEAMEEEPMAEGASGKVSLWYGWNEDETPALNSVIGAFQEANPNVEFEVLFKPFDDLRGAYETATASGDGPTILLGAADWGPALYDASLVADLTGHVDTAAVNPAALGAVEYNGALVGLPHTIKGVVMYRNAAVVPDAPATWDDVKALGDVVDIERGFFFSAGHLIAQGGELMDAAGNPAFNSAAGEAWLGMMADFNDSEYYGETDADLFKAGELGIIVDGTWNLLGFADAVGADNLFIDPWPTGLSGFVQTDNIYLSANAEGDDESASVAFINFFMSEAAQSMLVDAAHIPAIAGVEVSDPHLAMASTAFESGVAFPVIPQMGSYWEPMDGALNAVYEEGVAPSEAIATAFSAVSGALGGEQMMEEEEMMEEMAPVSGTISLWYGWNEEETPALNKVIEAFQAANPDVEFEVLFKPFDDLRGAYETATASGDGPSILLGAADWGPALYDASLVADLTGMVSDKTVGNINGAALSSVEYGGALVGLPHTIKGVAMFRNASVVPDAPATWDDVKALGDVVDIERGFFFSAGHLFGQGGELMDADGNPMFNTDAGVAWLNSMADFNDSEYYGETDVDLFKAGELGIIVDGTWNIIGLAEAIGADNLVIDPWPTGLSGFVQTDNIYLSANAEGDAQTASAAFIEFFLSADAQAMLVEAGHIPAIGGVEVNDPHLQMAVTAFEGGAPFPVIPQMGSYWEPMDGALNAVYEEGMDPAEALQGAFDAITTALDG